MYTAMMLMQARLNLPEISTFSFRTNTTDTPLNPHYPKIFEKKTRIETDEIVNHLSIYKYTNLHVYVHAKKGFGIQKKCIHLAIILMFDIN